MQRPSWDFYFMTLAQAASARSTCDRKHVGAVLVRNRTVLTTGYNGSISGGEHCDDAGHLMEHGHCVRTVHAEANAICSAAANSVALSGATMYVTALPCWPCLRLIVQAGITSVVYGEAYRDDGDGRIERVRAVGLEVSQLQLPL